MKLDLSPSAVSERLAQVDRLADLRPEHRLDAKIDLSAAAVTRRLELASELLDVCRALSR